MTQPEQRPSPFPTREHRDRGWEVLIVPEDNWLACENKQDAEAVGAAPVLEYESLETVRCGDEFAAELERTADALEKYRMGFGSRFFRQRAKEARRDPQ